MTQIPWTALRIIAAARAKRQAQPRVEIVVVYGLRILFNSLEPLDRRT